MLAAIIANLQNVQPSPPPPRPSVIKIDRGGGGGSWPGYDIVDIVGAIRAFPEMSAEDPVARAARRHRFIGDYLRNKTATENREAAAFLAGATLAHQVATEESEAELARVVALYDQAVEYTKAARARAEATNTQLQLAQAQVQQQRSVMVGAVVVGVVGGVIAGAVIASMIARSRERALER